MPTSLDDISSPRTRVIRWVSDAVRTGGLSLGEPLPSERVLAERLRVSRDTVRSALRSMADSGVIGRDGDRHRKLIARPGQAIKSAQSTVLASTIAILGTSVPTYQPPSSWDGSIHYTATRLLEQAGLHVLSINSRAAEPVSATQLVAMKPSGVLVTYAAAESALGQSIIRECQASETPVVTYGDGPTLQHVDRVNSDHAGGAYELTRHLISHGCQRILRLWRFPEDHHWLTQRNEGYERAMRDASLPVLPAVRTPRLLDNDVLNEEEFRHLTRMMAGYLSEYVLSADPIDGLMLATDAHAIQAAAALRLLGKTPNRDVRLVGYDNSYADYADFQREPTPPAATMDKGNARIAQELVSLLLDRVAGRLPADPQCRMVKPTLIVPEQQNSQSETASVSPATEV